MRKIRICILGALLAAGIAGCGAPQTAERGGTDQVVIAIDTEPETLDPTQGLSHGSTPIVQSTLVRYTDDMQLTNDLAADYELSADKTTWTFKLRTDARFTDGTPVTAEDVAFTLETAKTAQGAVDLTYMEQVRAADAATVEVKLSQPTSIFLNTLTGVGIVPKHGYDAEYGRHPIGSGPYRLVEWRAQEQMIFEANEDYYGEIPQLRRVTVVFMSEDAALAAVQAGSVDVAYTSATLAETKAAGYHLEALQAADNRGFTLPMQPDEGAVSAQGAPIGNDVTAHREIRQAIAYAIDRQQIADVVLHGFGRPAYTENDGMPWSNPDAAIQTDTDYAKKLLADGGWADTDGDGIVEKDGLQASFTCIYPAGDSVRQAIALAAAQQVQEIGIRIQVEGVSWDEIAQRMYSDAVMMGWGSTSPNETYYLYRSQGAWQADFYNPQGYQSSVTDGYLEEALQARTPEEANAGWQKVQWDGTTGTAMRGECPWVWIVNLDHVTYVRDGLSIGSQPLHGHGHGLSLIQNLAEWHWEKETEVQP